MNNMTTATDKRTALIAGLRALADFYETHPDMPIPAYGRFSHCVLGDDDAAGQAEVAAMAELLGVEMTTDQGSSNAERAFEGLEFKVFYVSRRRSADWRALTSYSGAVLADATHDVQSGR